MISLSRSLVPLALLLSTLPAVEPCRAAPAEQPAVASSAPAANRPVLINAITRSQKTAAVSVALAGMPIVLADDASQNTRLVAADMARVLERMTGQKVEVTTGDGSSGIVLGTFAEFPYPELAGALQIRNGFEGVEAYAIRTLPSRVLIIGAREVGARNGAYRLLHELGCRWLSPAPAWEIIPAQRDPKWNQDITDRPELLSRSIWYKTIFDWDTNVAPSGLSPSQERINWNRRNAHNESFTANTGEYYQSFVDRNKALFEAHPEYWPLIGGQRRQAKYAQLELGNAELRKLLVNDALARFRADREAAKKQNRPEITMVTVGPNDGGAWSQSDEFKALGSVSDAVFGMANEIARAVAQEFPGKMVGLYAYREWAEPPSFPLEPNVHVQLTPAVFTKSSRQELIELWHRKTTNMGYYDYYGPYYFHYDLFPGPSVAAINAVAGGIRDRLAHNATSISGESSGGWTVSGLGHYVANALMWNSSQNVEALQTDYLEKAFGPAATTMRGFYDKWNPENKPIVSRNLIYALGLDLQKASIETRNSPEVLRRLDDWKSHLRYMQLYYVTELMPKDAPFEQRQQAFIDLFRHLYTVRYTYAMHWGLAPQGLWQNRAEKLGLVLVEKTGKKLVPGVEKLLVSNRTDNPWRGGQFYTAGDIERNFQESLTYFKSPNIEEKKFSSDLVAIDWPAASVVKAPAAGTVLGFQGGMVPFAVYSRDGAPLEATFAPGTANGNFANRPWAVRDSAGKVVAQGEVDPKATAPEKKLSIPLPRAGQYTFEPTDVGAGIVTVTIPPTTPVSILLRRGNNVKQYTGPQPLYFYVPKGTQTVDYFYEFWRPEQKVVGPDGAVVYQTPGNTKEWSSVPVPAGMDGKVWRLDVAGIGGLWFANVPPVVAYAPDRLLVPRDVALKDGLTVQ